MDASWVRFSSSITNRGGRGKGIYSRPGERGVPEEMQREGKGDRIFKGGTGKGKQQLLLSQFLSYAPQDTPGFTRGKGSNTEERYKLQLHRVIPPSEVITDGGRSSMGGSRAPSELDFEQYTMVDGEEYRRFIEEAPWVSEQAENDRPGLEPAPYTTLRATASEFVPGQM